MKKYVGFGMGAIQAGLMLAEARDSGNFGSCCVAETDAELVRLLRKHDCRVTVNVAEKDGIRSKTIEGFTVENPQVREDRRRLGAAIAGADELATAIPGAGLYGAGGESSVAFLLAEFAGGEAVRVVYACENHNFAAELLWKALRARAEGRDYGSLHILNTVIGKMSGTIGDREEIEQWGLAPLVPGAGRAVLVEAFNRILVSRLRLPGYRRGFELFVEKDDLLPFEEAKLYGHNAVHSLLGYLARLKGYSAMSELRGDPGLLELGRTAFLRESGRPLVEKYGAGGETLFSESGFRGYAEDLLERMTNPYLHDKVERICRDPLRKLGYADRFFGAMRLALGAGITPRIMALGAAAALRCALETGLLAGGKSRSAGELLRLVWGDEDPDERAGECVALVEEALARLDTGEPV